MDSAIAHFFNKAIWTPSYVAWFTHRTMDPDSESIVKCLNANLEIPTGGTHQNPPNVGYGPVMGHGVPPGVPRPTWAFGSLPSLVALRFQFW